MLYTFILLVHIIVCMVLVGVILLQAGKGGLAETMGGSTAQSILGTAAGTFLTRATSVCAILFMVTCLSLTIISSHQTASLMRGRRGMTMPAPMPRAPVPTTAVPTAAPTDQKPGASP